jgi:sugar/nucleoside kinase (ribokinase family)
VRLPLTLPPPEAKPFDIVTLGLNSVDLVARVAEYPARNSKQKLQQLAQLPGGQMATAAAVCARLGWRARYIGAFGDDEFAAFGRRSLTDEGVDVSAAWNVPGATSQFAVVLVDGQTGDRTVLWHRHPGITMTAAQVPEAAVTSGRVVLVDCHETAAASAAARFAQAAKIPTVVDVEKMRDGIDELLRHIDVILAAEQFPSALTGYDEPGRALAAMAKEYRAPLVAVTLGAEGSLAWCDGREIRTPAFPVACIDSTGAGDAFHGGFVAGWLRSPDGEVADLMAYANAVAALNCRGLGARGGMPTQSEVEGVLRTR